MKKLFFLLLAFGAYQYGPELWHSTGLSGAAANAGAAYTRTEGNLGIDYIPEGRLDNRVFVILGGGDRPDMQGDMRFTSVPASTMKELSSRYPDIGKCKSPHTRKLFRRSQTINVFSHQPGLVNEARDILQASRDRLASSRNPSRLCVQLSGRTLSQHFYYRHSGEKARVTGGNTNELFLDLESASPMNCL